MMFFAIFKAAATAGATLTTGITLINMILSAKRAIRDVSGRTPQQRPQQRQATPPTPDPNTAAEAPPPVSTLSSLITKVGCLWQSPRVRAVRFLSLPVTAVLAQWALLLSPEFFFDAIPALRQPESYASGLETLRLHPNNVLEAFQLGAIWQMWSSGGTGAAAAAEALSKASAMAGRAVTAEELDSLPALLEQMVSQRSALDRLASALSLVNILTVVSLTGLTLLLGPVVYLWIKRFIPVHKIAPVVLRTARPTLAPLTTLFSFLITVESLRYREPGQGSGARMISSMTGTMLALSAEMLYAVANNRMPADLLCASMALHLAPVAVLHQSSLLGSATVACAIKSIDFVLCSTGLTTFIGFSSRKGLVRTAMACGTAVAGFSALEAAGATPLALAPFRLGVSSFGAATYLLALHIFSFVESGAPSTVLYLGNLATMLVAGEMIPRMRGLSVSAQSFGVLYALSAYGYYGFRLVDGRDKRTVVTFFFSCFGILYSIAMYLNMHPQVLIKFFDGCLPPI